MSKIAGKFVWYDVMTSDIKAAETFYRSVIGWDAKDSGMTDRSYTLLSVGPTMVGGLMPIPEEARAMGLDRAGRAISRSTMSTPMRRASKRPAARFTALPRIFQALAASPSPPIRMARYSSCSKAPAIRSPRRRHQGRRVMSGGTNCTRATG